MERGDDAWNGSAQLLKYIRSTMANELAVVLSVVLCCVNWKREEREGRVESQIHVLAFWSRPPQNCFPSGRKSA